MKLTCSSAVSSATSLSPVPEAASLDFLGEASGFLPLRPPSCGTGLEALPRDSLAGVISASLRTFRFSVGPHLDIRGEREVVQGFSQQDQFKFWFSFFKLLINWIIITGGNLQFWVCRMVRKWCLSVFRCGSVFWWREEPHSGTQYTKPCTLNKEVI